MTLTIADWGGGFSWLCTPAPLTVRAATRATFVWVHCLPIIFLSCPRMVELVRTRFTLLNQECETEKFGRLSLLLQHSDDTFRLRLWPRLRLKCPMDSGSGFSGSGFGSGFGEILDDSSADSDSEK